MKSSLVLSIFIFSCLPVLAEEAAPPAAAPAAVEALPGMERPAAPAVPASAPSAAVSAPAAEPVSGGEYVIRRGDTLWALAARTYHQPFDWPRIWEVNKSVIENPHLIYPDQRVILPGEAEVALPAAKPARVAAAPIPAAVEPEPEAEVEAEAEPEPEAEAAPVRASAKKSASVLPSVDGRTFIVDEKWRGDGRIAGDLNKRIMISQNDIIYVDIGASDGVRPGARADVVRRGRRIRNPESGRQMGYSVRRVGVIEFTSEVGDDNSTAVVINSDEPMKVGDIVQLRR
jgi:hypothetical protein